MFEEQAFDFEEVLAAMEARDRRVKQEIQQKNILDKGKKMYDVVCRHWAYGAGCMKGLACEFLHEHNRDKMPICIHFMKNKCSRGRECMFRHVKEPCHAYERGHCPRGPDCTREHVKHTHMCINVQQFGVCRVVNCTEPHPRPM